LFALILICIASQARADFWGGDDAILAQILVEDIQSFEQLRMILQTGSDQRDLLRALNDGIDNSIGLLGSLPIKDEKVLSDLRNFKGAMGKVESLYGVAPLSPVQNVQVLEDQTVAESLKMADDFKEYSATQERNSDVIARDSREASTKGAVRMQAETSAEILRTLSQLLRLNTQMLKLQSEQVAVHNKTSKDEVTSFQKVNQDIGSGFSNFKPDMSLNRF
jgi:hypothetical protein